MRGRSHYAENLGNAWLDVVGEVNNRSEGPASQGAFSDAKYYVCAGDMTRALAILREGVAKGFHDPIVLHDPAFASLRTRSDFAPIAAAVTPRVHQ